MGCPKLQQFIRGTSAQCAPEGLTVIEFSRTASLLDYFIGRLFKVMPCITVTDAYVLWILQPRTCHLEPVISIHGRIPLCRSGERRSAQGCPTEATGK